MQDDRGCTLRRRMPHLYRLWLYGRNPSRPQDSLHKRSLQDIQCLHLLGFIGVLLQLSFELRCSGGSGCTNIHAHNYYNLLDTINIVIDCLCADREQRNLPSF